MTTPKIQEWLAKLKPRKVAKLQKAYHSAQTEGLMRGTGFVKMEISTGKLKPRWVTDKHPSHCNLTGPWMNEAKKKLMKAFDGKKGCVAVVLGMNPVQQGKLVKEMWEYRGWSANNPSGFAAVEADGKTFEVTMTAHCRDLENHAYRIMGVPEPVRELFFGNTHFDVGFLQGKGDLSVKMDACRESGSTNTTTGNSLVYATVIETAIRSLKLDQKKVMALVSGDDCVVYYDTKTYSRSDMEPIFNIIRDWGIIPETVDRENPLAARFLGGYFLLCMDCDGRTTVAHFPQIGKAMARAFTFKLKQGEDPLSVLHDSSVGRQKVWSYVPILGPVMQAALKRIRPGKKLPSSYERDVIQHAGKWYEEVKCTDDTWAALAEVYDVSTNELRDLERFIVGIVSQPMTNWGGTVFNNTVLERLYSDDIGDPLPY